MVNITIVLLDFLQLILERRGGGGKKHNNQGGNGNIKDSHFLLDFIKKEIMRNEIQIVSFRLLLILCLAKLELNDQNTGLIKS